MKEKAIFAPVVCIIGADSLKLDSSNVTFATSSSVRRSTLFAIVNEHDEFVP